MQPKAKVRVAVSGCGVIVKRIVDAVARQEDLVLVGTRTWRRIGGCAW